MATPHSAIIRSSVSRNANGVTDKKADAVNQSHKAATKRSSFPPKYHPSQYIPGRFPVTVEDMKKVYNLVQNEGGADPDLSLGQYIVQLIPELDMSVRDKYLVKTGTAESFSKGKNLMRHPCLTRDFPVRYMPGKQTDDASRFPVVFIDSTNAPYSESIRASKPGFAYMTSQVSDALLALGQFHLYNRPMLENAKKTAYRYNGIFVVHKTPYALSPGGWQKLPNATKLASATMRHIGTRGGSISAANDVVVQPSLEEFNTGVALMPLMLFECTGFVYDYANGVLKADCGNLTAVMPSPVKQVPPRAVIESQGEAQAQVAKEKQRANRFVGFLPRR